MPSNPNLIELFERAAALSEPEARRDFLDAACADDVDLRRRIEKLLDAETRIDKGFLEQPAIVLCSTLLSGSTGALEAAVAAPEKVAPGQHVGPYRLIKVLGQGGMGTVYLAEQELPVKRRVALKLIRSGLDSAQIAARFEIERQALALMTHPNIARVLDAGTSANGAPYFVMELVPGQNITDHCDALKLTVRERLQLFLQVCSAIQHAHQNGLIHRDIKPSNVLVCTDGDKPIPKVIDFGLAKAIDRNLGVESFQTQAGSIFGTLEYMSPEQSTSGGIAVDTRSDVYSLGVLLYELLTGTTPIERERLQAGEIVGLLRALREEEAPRPSIRALGTDGGDAAELRGCSAGNLALQLRGDLDWITLKALEKERERRYQSPLELAKDIQNHLDDKAVLATPPSGMYTLRKWVRRNRALFASACAVLIALGLGGAGMFVQWRGAVAARDQAVAAKDAQARSSYSAMLGHALAAREHHDFGQARRLLYAIKPEMRGFEWRLLKQFCDGDDLSATRFGEGEEASPDCLDWVPGKSCYAVITADSRLFFCSGNGEKVSEPRALPKITIENSAGIPAAHRIKYSPSGRNFAHTFGWGVRIFESESLKVVFEAGAEYCQAAWLDDNRLLFGVDRSMFQKEIPGAWIADLSIGNKTDLGRGLSAPLAVSFDGGTVALCEAGSWNINLFLAKELVAGKPFRSTKPMVCEQPQLLALSPRGEHLVCACGNMFDRAKDLSVEDIATGSILLKESYHTSIRAMAMNPRRAQLATASDDACVRLFNYLVPTPKGMKSYDDGTVAAIRQPVDGNGPHDPPRNLMTRSAMGGRVAFLLGHEDRIKGLHFAAGGRTLSTVSADGTLRRWPSKTSEESNRVDSVLTSNFVSSPAASLDGKRILLNRLDNESYLWRSGMPLLQLPQRSYGLAVLKDGRYVCMNKETKEIVMWALNDGKPVESWRIPGPKLAVGYEYCKRGVLSRDERYVAGCGPGCVFVVDLVEKSVASSGDLKLRVGVTGVLSCDLSPDGQWIAATGLGARTVICSRSNPALVVHHLGDEREFDTVAAFHPNGKLLFTGSEDGSVRVWETTNWTEVKAAKWEAHNGAVTAIATSNDGSLVATSGDSSLKLWPAMPQGGDVRLALLAMRVQYFPCNWLHFAADRNGRDCALLHSAPWGTLDVWETEVYAPSDNKILTTLPSANK